MQHDSLGLIVRRYEACAIHSDEDGCEQERDPLIAVGARLTFREHIQEDRGLRGEIGVLLVAAPTRTGRGERRFDNSAVARRERVWRSKFRFTARPRARSRTLDNVASCREIEVVI